MSYQSARLLVKEISWDDLETIHKLHSFPEVDEFNTIGIPKDLNETKAFLKPYVDAQKSDDRSLYLWKILRKDANKVLEKIGMTREGLHRKILPICEGL